MTTDDDRIFQALWELHADTAPVSTLAIASRAGFAEPGPMGTDGRARALPTLRRLADDRAGVELDHEAHGDYHWTLDPERAERPTAAAAQAERLDTGGHP